MQKLVDDEELLKLRHNNKCATLQNLADHFGVTKERIRQKLNKLGEPTIHFKQKYICNHCGKTFLPKWWDKNKLYCSKECGKIGRHKEHHVIITCAQCGKERELKLSEYLYQLGDKYHAKLKTDFNKTHDKLHFCSHSCNTQWLWANLEGMGRHKVDKNK